MNRHSQALAPSEWNSLREFIESETGMDLAGSRAPRLREAIDRVLPHFEGVSIQELQNCSSIRGPFLDRLTGELTIGESFFFRNANHFDAIRQQVLPQLFQQRSSHKSLKIWHVGCATGEEPYSMAILLDQGFLENRTWEISILGSDLNPAYLDRAREGKYREWSFRGTEIHEDTRYFTPDGTYYRVAEFIRKRVRFQVLNLVKDIYPSALTGTVGLDLIFFRNVAIYLKPEVTRQIIERLRSALKPGGWLLLGESEVGLAPKDGFHVHQLSHAVLLQKPMTESVQIKVSSPATPVLKPSSVSNSPLPRNRPSQATFLTLEDYLQSGELSKAEVWLSTIPFPRERANLRLQYVHGLLARSEIEHAMKMLSLCQAEDSLLLEAHLLHAGLLEEAGELIQAEAAYRRTLYLDRNCLMAHFHLGLLEWHNGSRESASRSLHTALQLTEGKELEAMVDYGEGVCYGRVREIISSLIATENESHS